MSTRRAWITMDDGVRLAATLYLPDHRAPCLLEALPYRMDDLTASYADEYVRLRDQFGFAVCRLDLRGTGSSEGIAVDEYPVREQDDLVAVIAWLAGQAWCTGAVGMFGTSYSGFNSIQVALRQPPALRAIAPIYATDDRYTDDVHYMGGARRLLDLVDYPTYMIAMNALPPVPAVFGDGWRSEWRRRLDQTPPWLPRWFDEAVDSPYWRHGSLRPGYERLTTPTLIIAGWADGYRNNTLRTVEALSAAGTPVRLLAGPWSHMSAERALPGPHLDLTAVLADFFDQWLGRGSAIKGPELVYFSRSFTAPEPDAAVVNGEWRAEPTWPSPRSTPRSLTLGGGQRHHVVPGGVGTAAWNSCAGALPWGQSTDQRFDDAASLTWQWPAEPGELLGLPSLRLRVAADQPVATVSAKLSEVGPDGSAMLICRGLLNLTHRSTEPEPLVPHEFVDVTVELETAAWTFTPGHTLRLAVTGMDWPNTVAPPRPVTLTIDGDASTLTLPLLRAEPTVQPPTLPFVAPPESSPTTAVWRITDDVLNRRTEATTQYGGPFDTPYGQAVGRYTGEVAIDRRMWTQTATGGAAYELTWPETTVAASTTVEVIVDETEFALTIGLTVTERGELVHERSWQERYPRGLA